MKPETTISVAIAFGKTLHTREVASELLRMVAMHPCNSVELDFAGVDYISRSFADQFHGDKLTIAATSQKTIVVANATEEVVRMLQAVARTQNKTYANGSLPVFKYSDWTHLENFLLSI